MNKPNENERSVPSIFAAASHASETHWRNALPRLLSIGVHIFLIKAALMPWTAYQVPVGKGGREICAGAGY